MRKPWGQRDLIRRCRPVDGRRRRALDVRRAASGTEPWVRLRAANEGKRRFLTLCNTYAFLVRYA